MPEETKPAGYMRQLDGLRCIAVMAVLYGHWVPREYQLDTLWARLGVRLFFVLSGFLITGILLRCRDDATSGLQTHRYSLRQFYARRFLRIFPLYYMTLLVAFTLGSEGVRAGIFWHLSYLSNFYFALVPDAVTGTSGHLWSLAVEEQFYVLWPCIILFVPRRALLPVIVAATVAGFVYRYAMVTEFWHLGYRARPIIWLTPGCLDALGIGALIAYLTRYPAMTGKQMRILMRGCFAAGVLLYSYVYWGTSMQERIPAILKYSDSSSSLVFAWAVYGASTGFKGVAGKILESRPFVYMGRVSYGIYIFHPFVQHVYETRLAAWTGLPESRFEHPVAVPLILLVLAVSAASLSWYVMERPLNGLKRHFPYRRAVTSGSTP